METRRKERLEGARGGGCEWQGVAGVERLVARRREGARGGNCERGRGNEGGGDE